MWNQVYDPFGSPVLSTLVAAIPVVTLLVLIATNKVKAHWAAVIALAVALLVVTLGFTMPTAMRCAPPGSASSPASSPSAGSS